MLNKINQLALQTVEVGNNIRPDTSNPDDDARPHSAASRPAGRPGDDVVRWSEFRLALWVGGLALTAILGSQGFLYSAIIDLPTSSV